MGLGEAAVSQEGERSQPGRGTGHIPGRRGNLWIRGLPSRPVTMRVNAASCSGAVGLGLCIPVRAQTARPILLAPHSEEHDPQRRPDFANKPSVRFGR